MTLGETDPDPMFGHSRSMFLVSTQIMLSRALNSLMRARVGFNYQENLITSALQLSEQPQFALAQAGLPVAEQEADAPLSEIMEGLWLAVPKSKISRSRKRMKWKQHIPKPVAWAPCPSCGEPKRPHRLCGTCLSKKLRLEKHGEE